MPERLDDADDQKWIYHAHTSTKHGILAEYLKGWIAILARAGLAANRQRVRLLLVDAFAGRGRYVGGEAGSPLVIAGVADQLIDFLNPQPGQVELDCAFIEAEGSNHERLVQEIEHQRRTVRSGVVLRDPIRQTFDHAIGPLLALSQRYNGVFVFVDPFGFGDIPMSTMARVLAVPRGVPHLYGAIRQPLLRADRSRRCLRLPVWRVGG